MAGRAGEGAGRCGTGGAGGLWRGENGVVPVHVERKASRTTARTARVYGTEGDEIDKDAGS